MLKNYFKIALRNFIKNKSHTFINVSGLTLGIVCALVIFLVIQYDLSFDTWHEDGDRIYRVVREESEFGNIGHDPGGPYPLTEAIRNGIYGIEKVSLVNNNYANTPVVSYYKNGVIQKKFKEEYIAFVDQEYFDIFTYHWITGDPEKALEKPNTVVITESFAKKLFGRLDVPGEQVTVNMGALVDLEVTGVVKDVPENSDFPFVFLASSHSHDRDGNTFGNDNWGGNSSSWQNYVKLKEGVSPEEVNAQFDPLITKYRSEDRTKVLEFFLQPLSEIHFDSRFGTYSGRVIEKRILFALGIIGSFLLITACINFINLNTAIAVTRSKEVGLRKTLGGTKTQLTLHFLGETAFVTLIALVLGVGVTEVVLNVIEPVLGFTPGLNLTSNSPVPVFLAVLFLGITIAAGWYPARHLSGFNPIEAIRGKINARYGRGLTLRRSLIVIQFTITQILIIGMVVIASQIRFFQDQDLGFDKEAVVQVELPNQDKQILETFKNRLKNETSILNVTFSNTGTTHGNVWGGNYVLTDDTVRKENDADVKFIDEDFIDTYGLTILAGKNLVRSDSVNMYLVNEAFAKQVGYGDNYDGLIGKPVRFWGSEAPIVGVVNDFNTSSLHQSLRPVVLTTRPSYYIGGIKINMNRTADALEAIRQAYNEAFPDFVFEYTFLDEHIARMYKAEQRTARIMNIFTIVAILIGCLGLFGLVSYMAATRTKEIGVRKVLGAGIPDILKIFATELAVLTGIAFALAAPVSWYLMQQWLADFAYRIDPGIGIFAAALGGTLLIAVLTVGYKSFTAAIANPVESLKSE